MKIKVCGLKEPENIYSICDLGIDFMGLIFYKKSPRYVGKEFEVDFISEVPNCIKKVGVFVNESTSFIISMIKKYNLQVVQLHGDESVSQCMEIWPHAELIKAFSVDRQFDFRSLEDYMYAVDYFLFDTKAELYGGSGMRFDWSILNSYNYNKAFFLSGGIDENAAKQIQEIEHPFLYAIDLNSKFEDSPGKKNISKIKSFINQFQNEQYIPSR